MPALLIRTVDVGRPDMRDPADPWELTGGAADLVDFTRRRMAAYPRRPTDWDDMPPAAADALRAVLGPIDVADVLLVPRTPRPTGYGELTWVVAPAAALGVGAREIALWIDGWGRDGIAARIPLEEIAGYADLRVLLYGRLEIIGASASIVIRYNTVSSEFVRAVLRTIRRSFGPPIPTAAAGPAPQELPLKWTNVVTSVDVWPEGRSAAVVVPGSVTGRKIAHAGVAVLSPTELVLACEPSGGPTMSHYGVDTIVLPRGRIAGIAADTRGIRVTLATAAGHVEVAVPVDAVLGEGVVAGIAPRVAG